MIGHVDTSAIPVRLLWPEVLVVAVSLVCLLGMLTEKVGSPRDSGRLRLLAFTGFLASAALIFLGAIWPSYYTIAAIAAIPSPFVFAALMFRPAFLSNWPKVRIYLLLCVAAAASLWAFQLVWDLR